MRGKTERNSQICREGIAGQRPTRLCLLCTLIGESGGVAAILGNLESTALKKPLSSGCVALRKHQKLPKHFRIRGTSKLKFVSYNAVCLGVASNPGS